MAPRGSGKRKGGASRGRSRRGRGRGGRRGGRGGDVEFISEEEALGVSSRGPLSGVGTDGTRYASIEELWRLKAEREAAAEAAGAEAKDGVSAEFYRHGAEYWEGVDATAQGMLGGFAHISPTDVRGSRRFLLRLAGVSFDYAVDCGAGIGRVSRQLLVPLFQRVDLVEQNAAYVARAQELMADVPEMREYHAKGLQEFEPEKGRYSVIWIQWVIGHLPDKACAAFLRRCAAAVRPGGYVCLKENNAAEGFVYDEEDGSVTRSDALFRRLFETAGLELVDVELQDGFPDSLFDVRMYALQARAAAGATADAGDDDDDDDDDAKAE